MTFNLMSLGVTLFVREFHVGLDLKPSPRDAFDLEAGWQVIVFCVALV
ncbi:hypothetical protein [Bradyrhizobium japonicum]|nr:hypothetical protein [Bradyrhizobium japonicum]